MPNHDQSMGPANSTFWIVLSAGCALFLAGFLGWAAVFGIGGGTTGTSPGQQQALGSQQQPANQTRGGQAPQTTGQAPAAQPAQQQEQKK